MVSKLDTEISELAKLEFDSEWAMGNIAHWEMRSEIDDKRRELLSAIWEEVASRKNGMGFPDCGCGGTRQNV